MHAHLSPPRASSGTAVLGVTTLVLAHVGVDAVTGSVSVVLPRLADRFGLSGAEVGALVATLSASALLSQPIAGRFADRVGHRRVAVVGAALASALLSLLVAIEDVRLLYAAVIVGGLGSAGFHPAAASLARSAAPRHSALAVSLFSAGGMVGLASGPLLFVAAASEHGAGWTPLLMVPGVALAAVLHRVLPPGGEGTSPTSPEHRVPIRPLLGLAAAGTTAAIAVTTFTAGMPLLLAADSRTAGNAALGWTLAAFDVGAAAGGLAAGWASKHVPARLLATWTLLGSPAPLLYALHRADGSLAYLGTVALGGALANAAVPLLIVAAQGRARGAVAAASGVLMGLTNGIGGLSFLVVGATADVAGLEAAVSAGLLAVIPAGILAGRALRDREAVVIPLAAARSCTCTVDRRSAACTIAA